MVVESFFSILELEFIQNAIAAGILVSIACGIIGTFVVVNRIVFITGGIAHSAYGGIGLGYFLGFNPVIGAIAFAILSGLGMGIVEQKTTERSDTIIGTMWAIGMSVGIIAIDLTQGYKANLMSYLFGSILAVTRSDLSIMLVLDIIIITAVCLFYKELLAISFDSVFATTRNLPVQTLYLMLISAIALTVVMVMQVVGLIMVIALMTIPSAVANQFVKEIKQMMILSVLISILFILIGLWLAYIFNLTSGATIILVCGSGYFLSLAKSVFQPKQLQR